MLAPEAVAEAARRLVGDGFSESDVQQLTLLHAQHLHALGRRVRLRQRVVATACVFFHRFFAVRTFLEHDPLLVAPTVLWMASKVEECTVSPKTIVREMAHLGLRGNEYEASQLLAAEYVVLEVLMPFGLTVEHPHASLARLLAEADLRRHVGVERSDCLVQTATFLANDACRAPEIALCCSPRVVALCCALVAALLEHVPLRTLLPLSPSSAEEHDAIERVAASLLSLYNGLHGGGGRGGPTAAPAGSASRPPPDVGHAHERLTEFWAGAPLDESGSGGATREGSSQVRTASCAGGRSVGPL